MEDTFWAFTWCLIQKVLHFSYQKSSVEKNEGRTYQNFSTSPDMMVALERESCAIYKAGEQHSQPSCRMRARAGWRGLNGIGAPDPMSFCLTRPVPAQGRRGKSSNKGKMKVLVIQLCLTLCDSMDCRLLGFSIQGILQARILEWVAIAFRQSSKPRIEAGSPTLQTDFLPSDKWKTQQWPQDWKRSVFIPVPKKGNAKECSEYCTIALISYASKVTLKILQASLQQYVSRELPDV